MSSGLAKFHVGLRPHFRRIHVTTPARGIFSASAPAASPLLAAFQNCAHASRAMFRRAKPPKEGRRRASLQLNEWTLRDGRADRGCESSDLRASWHASLWRPWRRKLTRAYSRAEVVFSEWFAWHGNWISHHQRRTVLLCNLVIASLFYPAVVLYLLTCLLYTSPSPRDS